MLIRLAIAASLGVAAAMVGFVAANSSARTGLAADQELAFFLSAPFVYLLGSMWISVKFVAWLGGWDSLPAWVRGAMRSEMRLGSRDPEVGLDRDIPQFAEQLPRRARVLLAAYVFVRASLWLAFCVPIFALLLILLARGAYEPWQALIVGMAGIGTAAWLAFLAFRISRWRGR